MPPASFSSRSRGVAAARPRPAAGLRAAAAARWVRPAAGGAIRGEPAPPPRPTRRPGAALPSGGSPLPADVRAARGCVSIAPSVPCRGGARLPQRVCGRVSVFRVVPLENVRYRVPSSAFLDAASCPSRAFGLTQRVWACWGSRALRGRRTGIRRVEACVGAAGGVCSGLSALGRRDGLCDGVTEPGRPRGARGCGGGAPSAGAGCEHRGGSAAASMMQHRVRPRRRGGSLSVPGSLCCVNASWHTGSFVCRVWSLLCVLFEGDNRTPVPVMAVREGRRCLCSERGVVRRSEVRHLLCSQLRSANYCLQSEKMR